MSRWRESLRSRRAGSGSPERGFSLVEVLVAFLIIAIVSAAGASVAVHGLKATADAKQLSQAKNLVGAQAEELRGLPYYVSYATSNAKVDLLDRYYPGLTPVAGAATCTADPATWLANRVAWSGFVADGAARCAWEPPVGTGDDSFFRCVEDPDSANAAAKLNSRCGHPTTTGAAALATVAPTVLVSDVQFVAPADGKGTAAAGLAAGAGYDRTSTDKDTPASQQVAAYVTGLYGQPGATPKRTTTRTEIADQKDGPALVSAETNAAAVVVDGVLDTGAANRLELGSVAGDGSVTTITKSAVEAAAASMQTETGRLDGAAQTGNAPGVVFGSPVGTTISSGIMQISPSQTAGVAATSTLADPGFGQAVASAQGGSFAIPSRASLGLSATRPLVKVDPTANATLPGSGSCPIGSGYGAAGAGWMDTGVGPTKTLGACAQSEATMVKLFPVDTVAPEGLVQVDALDLVTYCAISGATPTAVASGTVKVRVKTGASYSETTLTYNGSTFTGTLPALSTVLANSKTLGDYIGSWAAFSGAQTITGTTGGPTATARIPAALSLSTVPLRVLADNTTPDPASAVKVTVGRALCTATDRRP